MNLDQVKKKIERYKKLSAEIAALKADSQNLKEVWHDILRGNWGMIHMTKHDATPEAPINQIQELLRNRHAEDLMKERAAELLPSLEKVHVNLKKARTEFNELKRYIGDFGDGVLGQIQGEFEAVKQKLEKKIVAFLAQFTSEFSARQLAKETDTYKRLEHQSTLFTPSVDPETILGRITSQLSTLEQYQELVK